MLNKEVQNILSKLEELGINDFEFDFVFGEENETISTSIHLYSIDEFEEGQLGYRVDDEGNSLVGSNADDWKENWFVIGFNELGDPIFVDIDNKNYPILTLEHDGEWEPFELFGSLEDLIKTVK